MYVFFIKKATGTPFFDKDFHSFKEPAFAGPFFAVRRTAGGRLGRSVANMMKRMLSGIRDLWIVLLLSDGENVITDSSCSTSSGQNGSCGSTGSKVCGVSVLHKP